MSESVRASATVRLLQTPSTEARSERCREIRRNALRASKIPNMTLKIERQIATTASRPKKDTEDGWREMATKECEFDVVARLSPGVESARQSLCRVRYRMHQPLGTSHGNGNVQTGAKGRPESSFAKLDCSVPWKFFMPCAEKGIGGVSVRQRRERSFANS